MARVLYDQDMLLLRNMDQIVRSALYDKNKHYQKLEEDCKQYQREIKQLKHASAKMKEELDLLHNEQQQKGHMTFHGYVNSDLRTIVVKQQKVKLMNNQIVDEGTEDKVLDFSPKEVQQEDEENSLCNNCSLFFPNAEVFSKCHLLKTTGDGRFKCAHCAVEGTSEQVQSHVLTEHRQQSSKKDAAKQDVLPAESPKKKGRPQGKSGNSQVVKAEVHRRQSPRKFGQASQPVQSPCEVVGTGRSGVGIATMKGAKSPKCSSQPVKLSSADKKGALKAQPLMPPFANGDKKHSSIHAHRDSEHSPSVTDHSVKEKRRSSPRKQRDHEERGGECEDTSLEGWRSWAVKTDAAPTDGTFFACYCGLRFLSWREQISHLVYKSSSNLLFCRHCRDERPDASFQAHSVDEILEHYEKEHGTNVGPKIVQSGVVENNADLWCAACNKQFQNHHTWFWHFWRRGCREHACVCCHCDRKVVLASTMIQHIIEKHGSRSNIGNRSKVCEKSPADDFRKTENPPLKKRKVDY